MYFTQVLCVVLIIANYASAKGYGVGRISRVHGVRVDGYGTGDGAHGTVGGYSPGIGGYGIGAGYGTGSEHYDPKPYSFGYAAPDGLGINQFRQEKGNGAGNVQGSYGYTDHQGLYRQVDYVSNVGGFRASVKTNEPGIDGKEHPADVDVVAEKTPSGVQEKYTRTSSYGVGAHGAGALGRIGRGFAAHKAGTGGIGGENVGIGAGGYGNFGGYKGIAGGSSKYVSGFGGNNAGGVGGAGKISSSKGFGLFPGISRSSSGKSGY